MKKQKLVLKNQDNFDNIQKLYYQRVKLHIINNPKIRITTTITSAIIQYLEGFFSLFNIMAFNKTKKGGKKHLPMKKKGKYTAKRTAKKNKTSKKKGGLSMTGMKNKISEKMIDMKDQVDQSMTDMKNKIKGDKKFYIEYKTKGIFGEKKKAQVGIGSTFASEVDTDGNRKQVKITAVRSNLSLREKFKKAIKNTENTENDDSLHYKISYKRPDNLDNYEDVADVADFLIKFKFYKKDNEYYEVTNFYKE
jgi:hypothetical protein